jgi:hypothetical protein
MKFTSDGKKVVIVGKLNAQETIVQEVFVTTLGAEIPSEENFVVKSLHDEVVMSWKEKKILDVEKEYKTVVEKREEEIKILKRETQKVCAELRLKMKAYRQYLNCLSETDFDRLVGFLSGTITHVVMDNWDSSDIVEIGKFKQVDSDYEKLKLVTLFGGSEGKLDYRINKWHDGSGSNDTIIPCNSYEEALKCLTEIFYKKNYVSDTMIERANKYGIELDAEKVKKHREGKISNVTRQLLEAKKRVLDLTIQKEALK